MIHFYLLTINGSIGTTNQHFRFVCLPPLRSSHPPTSNPSTKKHTQNNGKSQESSSEAINAYYGAHLFGRATGDRKLERFAQLLLAMEIRSTKTYWHMRNATTMYDPDFAANKMVGVVGGLDATCHTWFGEKFEFVVRGRACLGVGVCGCVLSGCVCVGMG